MRIMQSKKGDLGASEGEWAVSACFSGIKKPACGRLFIIINILIYKYLFLNEINVPPLVPPGWFRVT